MGGAHKGLDGGSLTFQHSSALSILQGDADDGKEERKRRRRRHKKHDAGDGGSEASGSKQCGISIGGRHATTLTPVQLKEKLLSLSSELEQARDIREQYTMELAKKGLLAITMDAELNFPVMRGHNIRMANVSRNMQAVSGFHNENYNEKITGLNVDQTLKKISHQVSPSLQSFY